MLILPRCTKRNVLACSAIAAEENPQPDDPGHAGTRVAWTPRKKVEDNCDGTVDEGVTTVIYWAGDGDGYGNALRGQRHWYEGEVANATDCDDHCDLWVPDDFATIQAAIDAALVGEGGSTATVLEGAEDEDSVLFVHGEGRGAVREGIYAEDGVVTVRYSH